MRVELRLGGLIDVDGRSLPLGRTFALLDGLAEGGSMRRAAERLEEPEDAAQERAAELGRVLKPVVIVTDAGGAVLTPFGSALRDALARTLAAFAPLVEAETRRLEERLAALTDT
jgi:molybdenum-dependent DNA-binding transcriptional regulator ModE